MEIKNVYNAKKELTHVLLSRLTKIQRVTQRVINKGLQLGYLSISAKYVTFKSVPKDVTYKILRVPGLYSCYDDKPFATEFEARDHIAKYYKDVPSPDTMNPAGYRQENFFTLDLEN
jgi:hypothetical protein